MSSIWILKLGMSLFQKVPMLLLEFQQDIDRLSPFCSSCVAVWRPFCLSEFNPNRVIMSERECQNQGLKNVFFVPLGACADTPVHPWWSNPKRPALVLQCCCNAGMSVTNFALFIINKCHFWICWGASRNSVCKISLLLLPDFPICYFFFYL